MSRYDRQDTPCFYNIVAVILVGGRFNIYVDVMNLFLMCMLHVPVNTSYCCSYYPWTCLPVGINIGSCPELCNLCGWFPKGAQLGRVLWWPRRTTGAALIIMSREVASRSRFAKSLREVTMRSAKLGCEARSYRMWSAKSLREDTMRSAKLGCEVCFCFAS